MFGVKRKQTKVGIVFGGGCGTNILYDIIKKISPDDYPDFYLFCANTDANLLQDYFSVETNERLNLWKRSKKLVVHQLGGDEVTNGCGAGGDPAVGRHAAETEGSMAALGAFIGNVDEVMLVGAQGGGTGGGFLPIAAQVAKSLGKTTIAIVVMPHPREKRNKKAISGLKEVRELVPTIPIFNSYISEYKKTLAPEISLKFSMKDSWTAVNEHSIVPLLLILREIIQVPGDVKNFDQNDWKTVLSKGNYVLFGVAKADPNRKSNVSAEELSNELFSARFQDQGIIEQGLVAGLWAHGPWEEETVLDVMQLVNERICRNDPSKSEDVEIHWGMRHETTDSDMWMSLIVVAREEMAVVVQSQDKRGVAEVKNHPVLISKSGPAIGTIRFRLDGVPTERNIEASLARRFNQTVSRLGLKREEIDPILDEVEQIIGVRPDLPEQVRDRQPKTFSVR